MRFLVSFAHVFSSIGILLEVEKGGNLRVLLRQVHNDGSASDRHMLCLCSQRARIPYERGEQVKHLSRRSYHIHFTGSVQLDRPLQPEQVAYLRRFLSTRRVSWAGEYVQELPDPLREAVGLPVGPEGAYFVGLSFNELKVDFYQPLVREQKLKLNKAPQGQPRLWCAWKLDEDGMTLRYTDKQELSFCYAWLDYLIDHFFTPWGYRLDGEIIWQGDDEADHGTIVVRQSHVEHRLLHQTGEKKLIWSEQPIACVHQDALETKLVCIHLANQGMHHGYVRWFTGQGRAFHFVCKQCAETIKQGKTTIPLSQICWRCYHEQEVQGYAGEMVGQPEILIRSIDLSIIQYRKTIPFSGRVLALQPVNTRQESIWFALTYEGDLVEINIATGSVLSRQHLPASKLNLDEEVELHIAPDGHSIALANTHGQHGIVLDLETGRVTIQLERDDYCIQHSCFPLAFFEDGKRLLLVHGTQWNRLDITDPRTGELLTARTIGKKLSYTQNPEHYLDYFHGGLCVSPDQQWIVDNGWMWHPVGTVVAWNVARWIRENPWESEDGPSQLNLCERDYYWDGPLCWINERLVAVWGYGDDEVDLIPAVRLFDVVDEKEIGWFAGPEGTLVFDEYLFALSEKQGLTAWDVATGERVLTDPDFHPTHYHRGAKQFLQIDAQQHTFHLGRLVDEHTSSS